MDQKQLTDFFREDVNVCQCMNGRPFRLEVPEEVNFLEYYLLPISY